MKNLVLITLAIVAVQLACSAPAPDNEKKAAAPAAPPAEVAADVAPHAAEAKAEVGVTVGSRDATPGLQEQTKGAAAEKAQ